MTKELSLSPTAQLFKQFPATQNPSSAIEVLAKKYLNNSCNVKVSHFKSLADEKKNSEEEKKLIPVAEYRFDDKRNNNHIVPFGNLSSNTLSAICTFLHNLKENVDQSYPIVLQTSPGNYDLEEDIHRITEQENSAYSNFYAARQFDLDDMQNYKDSLSLREKRHYEGGNNSLTIF